METYRSLGTPDHPRPPGQKEAIRWQSLDGEVQRLLLFHRDVHARFRERRQRRDRGWGHQDCYASDVEGEGTERMGNPEDRRRVREKERGRPPGRESSSSPRHTDTRKRVDIPLSTLAEMHETSRYC